MHGPVGNMRHLILLCVNWYLLVQLDRVDAEQFVEPVENSPLGAVDTAPSGLHRVLWVCFRSHIVRFSVRRQNQTWNP